MLTPVTLKLDFSEEKIGQAICALLNGEGGFIEVELPSELDEHLDHLIERFRKNIEPTCIFYSSYKDDLTWLIEVPFLLDQPYGYKDQVFILDHKIPVRAPMSILRSMLKNNSLSLERWERNQSIDLTLEELDLIELEQALNLKQQDISIKTYKNIVTSLYSWGLTKNGKLTNGADICLGKKPNIRLPQASIRLVAYETKTSDSYNIIEEISLPARQLINITLDKILDATKLKSYFFDDSATRKLVSLYPAKAVREAIVNAVAHRDYSKYSGGIQIYLDKLSLRITNTGSLPDGLDSEMLENPDLEVPSIIHNPNIANFLYEFDYMEKSGRGSKRILKACQDAGIKVNWEVNKLLHTVSIVFKLPNTKLDRLSEHMKNLIRVMNGNMSRAEIQHLLDIKDDEHFRKTFMLPALNSNLVAMTIPDKPRSKNQQYFLTQEALELKIFL